MPPTSLTLLKLPAEIRVRIWRFTLPHRARTSTSMSAYQHQPLPKIPADLQPWNPIIGKTNPCFGSVRQTRDEVGPFILKRNRVLKLCTDQCLLRFILEKSRWDPLDDLKVHLTVHLRDTPHTRMAQVMAKMKVVTAVQSQILGGGYWFSSVDLMRTDRIQELGTEEEMHIWAQFAVKARTTKRDPSSSVDSYARPPLLPK